MSLYIEELVILDQVQRPRQSKENANKKSNDEEENEAINLCETQKSTQLANCN